jgi:hypothetical protein
MPVNGADVNNRNVTGNTDGTSNAQIMDDAVDSLVETVLDKGGRVVFTDSGALEEHNRVAMILRY